MVGFLTGSGLIGRRLLDDMWTIWLFSGRQAQIRGLILQRYWNNYQHTSSTFRGVLMYSSQPHRVRVCGIPWLAHFVYRHVHLAAGMHKVYKQVQQPLTHTRTRMATYVVPFIHARIFLYIPRFLSSVSRGFEHSALSSPGRFWYRPADQKPEQLSHPYPLWLLSANNNNYRIGMLCLSSEPEAIPLPQFVIIFSSHSGQIRLQLHLGHFHSDYWYDVLTQPRSTHHVMLCRSIHEFLIFACSHWEFLKERAKCNLDPMT